MPTSTTLEQYLKPRSSSLELCPLPRLSTLEQCLSREGLSRAHNLSSMLEPYSSIKLELCSSRFSSVLEPCSSIELELSSGRLPSVLEPCFSIDLEPFSAVPHLPPLLSFDSDVQMVRVRDQ